MAHHLQIVHLDELQAEDVPLLIIEYVFLIYRYWVHIPDRGK